MGMIRVDDEDLKKLSDEILRKLRSGEFVSSLTFNDLSSKKKNWRGVFKHLVNYYIEGDQNYENKLSIMSESRDKAIEEVARLRGLFELKTENEELRKYIKKYIEKDEDEDEDESL